MLILMVIHNILFLLPSIIRLEKDNGYALKVSFVQYDQNPKVAPKP